MKRKRVLWRGLLSAGLGVCLPSLNLHGADSGNDPVNTTRPAEIQLVRQPQPAPPMPQPPMPQPPMPQPPSPDTPSPTGAPGGLEGARPRGSILGDTGGTSTPAPGAGRENATGPSSNVIQGTQAVGLASTDTGDLLGRSTSATGVETQKRSPIANEARIRGQRLGQITTHADGAFWFPARLDLDTFLSKIDSGLVQDIIVLKGPYSARYGPGLSFIDIATTRTPRYDTGFEWEGRTFSNYRTNGEQLYGRQSAWGGASDWGFRMSYGHRTGNDYRTGSGMMIPASYNARDADLAFGYDFSPVSRLEIGYMRLDQTNLEFPGQIFDTTFLVTDGARLRYILEEQKYFDRFVLDSWYNYTRLEGNAQRQGKRRQIPELNGTPPLFLNPFFGRTDIDLGSLGYRMAVTWGEDRCPQLTVGTDLRRLNGHLNEFDSLQFEASGSVLPCGNEVNFPIPRYQQTVIGGLFVEYAYPVEDRFVVKVGARGDYVNSDLTKLPPPGFTCEQFQRSAANLLGSGTDFEREYGLWLAYATAEYKLSECWTAVGGLGHSERPPTATELYAMEPFLAILQQGFTSVRGNVGLEPERLWQIDMGLRANYEQFRFGANGFCSIIQDYITYAALSQTQKGVNIIAQNALTVQFTNTDLATLAGFEVYTEFDYSDYLTPFMTMSYVSGRDHSRAGRGNLIRESGTLTPIPGVGALGANQEPLPGIPPFESRMGLRFHEARRDPRWGLELASRFVASQNQVASSLLETRSSGFAVYDVRSFWKARQGLLVTAGVENVFDRNYREHLDLRTGLGVFQPGINGYFGVEMRY